MKPLSSHIKALQKAGLNQNEAEVYIYLLENGKSTVQELLKATGLKRGNAYHLLYSLRDKDLIEQKEELKKLHFQLKDPYFLRDLIQKQRHQFELSALEVESALPDLLSLFKLTTNKPSVRVYEGLEGLAETYKELNSSKTKELLLMRSVYDDDFPEVEKLVVEQIKKQVKLGIHTRALTPKPRIIPVDVATVDPQNLVERRQLERKRFTLDAQVLIWNNTVAIVTLSDAIICTVIENKAIAQTMRTIFEYTWELSAEDNLLHI